MHMIVRERAAKKKRKEAKISIVDIYSEQSDAIKVMLKVGCAERVGGVWKRCLKEGGEGGEE